VHPRSAETAALDAIVDQSGQRSGQRTPIVGWNQQTTGVINYFQWAACCGGDDRQAGPHSFDKDDPERLGGQVRLTIHVSGRQQLCHILSLSQKTDALGEPHFRHPCSKVPLISDFFGTLRTTHDPANPLSDSTQLSERLQQKSMAFPRLHPACLHNHHGFGWRIKTGSDRISLSRFDRCRAGGDWIIDSLAGCISEQTVKG
jgi:hypothetical protein